MQEINYDTEFINLSLEKGVVIVTFKKGPITLEVAETIVKERLKFSKGKLYPTLGVDDGIGLTGIDREAREYLATGKALEGISASAFYTSSSFNKFLTTFFLKISNRNKAFPTKIFNDKEEAIKWLQNFVPKE